MGAFSKNVTINHVKKISPGISRENGFYRKRFDYPITHTYKRSHLSSSKKLPLAIFFQGSVTVEASFVLPIFLFCIMNLLFLFSAMEAESRVSAALHQTGNAIAFSGYAAMASGQNDGALSLLSVGYAKADVARRIGKSYLKDSAVRGDLIFLGSSVLEDHQMVDLQVHYVIKPFIKGFGMKDFVIKNRYYGRAWTGYEPGIYGSDPCLDDPMVYITPSGAVYHTNRNCSSLNPSVRVLPNSEIEGARSKDGSIYYPCDLCKRGYLDALVYVTEQGNRYHTSLSCSGIRRTISTVLLSEVGGRRKCLKCP